MKSVARVLLLLMAGLVCAFAKSQWAQAENAAAAKPEDPFIDVGACPFECCVYRRWTLRDAVKLVDTPRGNRIVAHLKKGDAVDALTGEVISWPAAITATRDVAGTRIKSGDTFYLVRYEGEGEWVAWFRGEKFGFEGPEVDGHQPRAEWWVKVKTDDAVIGWTKSENHFLYQDACE